MSPTTKVAASEAKTKFSELLERTKNGERFAITLHGVEVANLLPAQRPSLEEIRDTIREMELLQKRSILNPLGKAKLRLKDLIREGRR